MKKEPRQDISSEERKFVHIYPSYVPSIVIAIYAPLLLPYTMYPKESRWGELPELTVAKCDVI